MRFGTKNMGNLGKIESGWRFSRFSFFVEIVQDFW